MTYAQKLLFCLSNVHFPSQGLAFRGDGNEADFNFVQLLNLRSNDDGDLVEWLKHKTNKYIHLW